MQSTTKDGRQANKDIVLPSDRWNPRRMYKRRKEGDQLYAVMGLLGEGFLNASNLSSVLNKEIHVFAF